MEAKKSSIEKKKSNERFEASDFIDSILKIAGPAIGERIRKLREALKMNQGDLAAALGVGQPEIAKIEKGERAISGAKAKVLAKVLKASPGWILTGRD